MDKSDHEGDFTDFMIGGLSVNRHEFGERIQEPKRLQVARDSIISSVSDRIITQFESKRNSIRESQIARTVFNKLRDERLNKIEQQIDAECSGASRII